MLSARSSSMARTIWRSLATQRCARARGSSSRATCMVRVEPPETMRPLRQRTGRRRAAAPADRRRDGGGSACPRRRAAGRDSADRRRRRAPAAASGRRAVAKGRSSRPSRSTTRVENSSPSPSGARAEGDDPGGAATPTATAAAARCELRAAAPARRSRPSPHPHGGTGRAQRSRGRLARGESAAAALELAMTRLTRPRRSPTLSPRGERAAPCRGIVSRLRRCKCDRRRSLRRRDLDAAGAGAAEAIGPVHVLDIGLRQHVVAGRHRAHHIGDGEHRRGRCWCGRTPR